MQQQRRRRHPAESLEDLRKRHTEVLVPLYVFMHIRWLQTLSTQQLEVSLHRARGATGATLRAWPLYSRSSVYARAWARGAHMVRLLNNGATTWV